MRTDITTKDGRGRGGYDCPTCGQRDRHGCRDTLNGPFCAQWGLRFDNARLLHTAPNPLEETVKADPEVGAAAVLEIEAQKAFDACSAQWETAVAKLAAIRIKSAHDQGHWGDGWMPTIGLQRKLRREEVALVAEVDRLFEHRELLGRDLTRARVAYRRATDQARLRAGGGVMPYEDPPAGKFIIPIF